ncbi:hypothetical protein CRUP_019567 [Coryphaenoides rupestris]|nr:hypothetical protein CRUP_019567 [Coryphaenoides rupestris]
MDTRELRISRAMAFAIDEINNSSAILPGIKLGYQIHDTCASVPLTVQVAFQFTNDPRPLSDNNKVCLQSGSVLAIIGDSGSTQCISISRIVGPFDIPLVSHFATCACLSDRTQYPTFFRTIPSDQFQADALAKLVKYFGWTWIGAVRSNSDYGNNGMASFLRAAHKEGICVEYSESFNRNDPPSKIRQVADIIRRSTAMVVVAFAATGDLRFLLEELTRHPSPPRQWIGSEAWVTDPEVQRFQICAGAIGFAIQRSVIPGFREYIMDLSPAKVLDQLKRVNFSRNGYHVSFDANGDPVAFYELINWQKNENGGLEFVTVGHYDESLPLGQKCLCPYAVTVVRQEHARFSRRGNQFAAMTVYHSSDCSPCPKEFWPNAEKNFCLPKPVEFLSFHEVLGIILTSFSVGGACLTIVTAIVFFHHRFTPIVRANNSELSFLLLFSLTLCFLCSLTFIGRPSDWSCMLRHTAFGITFVLCISCVLGKTLVVLMAFKATLPARKLPDNFNEAKLITFSMLIFCAVWITFIPAYISSPGKFTVAVEIFAILASSFGLVICIFFPNMDMRELRFSRAMVFAIEEINNSSDLLPGITLGYQIHDSCAAVPVAVQLAFQLANGLQQVYDSKSACSRSGRVTAVVGESGSTPTISMLRIIGPFDIPQVSHFATCACLSDKTHYPSFFRTIPSDQFQADALAKLVKYFGWTWIGAVRSNSDYGNNGMASFLRAAHKEGICVEYSESFYRTDPPSKIQQVADVIRRSTASVVVAFTASGDMRILLEELARKPFAPRQWIGSESWVTDPEMLRFDFCAGAIGFGIPQSVIPGFREYLLDLSPAKVAVSRLLTELWEGAFNCQLEKTDRVCDGTEDLQKLQNPYTDTSQLRITNMVYKAVYAIAHAIHSLVCKKINSTIQCDRLIKIEPVQVLDQLKRVNFSRNGYHVSFDANGDPVAFYELINWQKNENGRLEFVTVGHYDESLPLGRKFNMIRSIRWCLCPYAVTVVHQEHARFSRRGNRFAAMTVYHLSDCSLCPKEFWPNEENNLCLPKPVEFLSMHEVLGIILVVFSVGGACLTIVTAIVFFQHRASAIVRANNSELSFLLLFSLTLCFLCSLTFIGPPSDWSCMLRHTAFGITFVLCISCVLGKTLVVLMAFRATLPGNNVMKWFGPAQQRMTVVSFTFVQVLICILWLVLKPPFSIRNLTTYNEKIILECALGFDNRAFRWMMTMIFAVEEINSNSALLPGVRLGYHIMDSCDHVHTSLRALLIPLVSITSRSESNYSALNEKCLYTYLKKSVTQLSHQVSYFATCACLTDKRTYPSFLRTVPSDQFQVRGLVELVTHFGWNWVGTVGTSDDYSRYGIQAFSHQFGQRGGCLAYHLTIPQSPSLVEIGAMADTLQSSKAKVVVAFATEGQLLELFSELAARNVTGIQWVASEAWITASLLTSPQFHFLLQGTLGFSFPGVYIPGLREFLLKVRPKAEPGFEFHNMLWEELFGCRVAFTEDPSRTNGSKFESNLNATSHSSSLKTYVGEKRTFMFSADENTRGAHERTVCTGSEDLSNVHSSYTEVSKVRISYNVYKAVYAIAHALHNLLECEPVGEGTAEDVGCKQYNKSNRPKELLHYLKMVNFTNQFGEKVYFDHNGEPVPLYDIINWKKDSKGEISDPCLPGNRRARRPGEAKCCFDCLPCAEGEISNQTDSTECTKCPEYYWSDERKVECVAGVDDFLSVYDTMGIILITLTLLGVVMTTIITTVFHHFRTTPIVKANNSEISFLLLVSLKLCFLCSLAFIGKPSMWTCRLRQAAFGVSFVLCLSCLLVKTIVVLLAFRSTVPSSGALKPFGPSQQRTLILCTTAPQIVVECRDPWPPGFYLVLGYIGLLASLCLLLAFLGRKLPDTFNEAKLITFSMIIFCAVWLSFIPAHVSSPGKFTVAVEIFAILASSFGLLLCIFAVRSVCSESCPPGKRVARRKGKPICCFDCVTCAEGEVSNDTDSLDCTRCPDDMWPNEMRNLCLPKNIEFLSYTEPMGMVLCAGSGLGACSSLLVLAMFYKHRATPVVRANNMELSFFLLLFLATCFLIALLFIGEPSDWLCRVRYPAFGVSFALCISCLLAKTFVVLMAFRATLPGSGVMNARALRWMQTMTFAVGEINRRTDLLPRLKLGFHVRDSSDDVPVSLKGSLILVNGQPGPRASRNRSLEAGVGGLTAKGDPIPLGSRSRGLGCADVTRSVSPVIIGDASSGLSMVLLRSLGPFHIPLVSYFASCSCLSEQQEFPMFMRTMPSDAFQVRALARMVSHFGWTWVGLIGADSDYARFAIQLFLQESSLYGVCPAYVHLYPDVLSQQPLDELLDIIQGASSKVIINFCSEAEVDIIMRAIRRRNITGIQWIASEAWATAKSLWEDFGDLLSGTLGFGIRRAEVIPGLKRYLSRLRPSNIHDSAFLTELWEEALNCRLNGSVNTHFHTVNPLDRKPCSGAEDFSDVYSAFSDVSQLRVSYNVYKAVYLVAHALQRMSDCEAGQGPFVNGTCGNPRSVEPWQAVRSVCSESCPPGKRVARRKGKPICCFDCVTCAEGEVSNDTDSLDCTRCPDDMWPNEMRNLCLPKNIEFLSYTEPMGMVLCAGSGLGACSSLLVLAMFYKHRATPVVRANNMELSFFLLLFLATCFLIALLFIGEPSDWLCRVRYPAFGVSFALCISCLLAKTFVVLMAFRATLPGSGVMKWFGPNQQRASVLLCTVVQGLICLIWLLTHPPFSSSNTGYLRTTIIIECAMGSEVGFWSVLGYIGLLACLCFVVAFLARELPDNFNEAKFITFSMLIFFAVWITFIPVYMSTAGKYTVAVHIFAILASAYGLFFCIFAPKCYVIILKPEKNSKKNMMRK